MKTHEHLIAPASRSHRDNGLHTFCVRCSVFFDAEGNPASAPERAVRNSIADRLAAARSDHPLIPVLRHGGSLN